MSETRKLRPLIVGQRVYVVAKASREWAKVEKVGRKYGYLEGGRKFSLESGWSVHECCNGRANGFGFDVFESKEQYEEQLKRQQDRLTLADLVVGRYGQLSDSVTDEQVQGMLIIMSRDD